MFKPFETVMILSMVVRGGGRLGEWPNAFGRHSGFQC